MYNFLTLYPSYVVLAIVLIIWAGIAFLLKSVDKKLSKIESDLELKVEQKGNKNE
jgi:hypothetical protein